MDYIPGPWEYGFPRLNGIEMRDADCQVSAHGFLIANVSHGPIYPVEPVGASQREANARLIAAAPELIAALRAAILAIGLPKGSELAAQAYDNGKALIARIDNA